MPFTTLPPELSAAVKYVVDEEYCSEAFTLAASQGDLPPGTILKNTAGTLTKVVPGTAAAGDDTCILKNFVANTTDTPKVAVYYRGPVILRQAGLNYAGANAGQTTTINTSLKAKGFVVR